MPHGTSFYLFGFLSRSGNLGESTNPGWGGKLSAWQEPNSATNPIPYGQANQESTTIPPVVNLMLHNMPDNVQQRLAIAPRQVNPLDQVRFVQGI